MCMALAGSKNLFLGKSKLPMCIFWLPYSVFVYIEFSFSLISREITTKEQRRYALRNLLDFGLGKCSMESFKNV